MIATIIRTFIIYCVVSVCVRLMGKRQLGELQPGELVVTILISEIAAIPIEDNTAPIINSVIPLLLLVSFEIISSVIDRKSVKFRYLTEGKPVTIIRNGTLLQKELKNLRFTINDVLSGLRQKDVFDIEDVEYAIVETNGTLSVLLKPDKRPATSKTIGKTEKDTGLPCAVVVDGKIIESVFEDCGITKNEVIQKIQRETDDIKTILLMTVDKSKKYNIIFKREC
ncbi:MAG: DUF421 domain-containing protein [Ruminococcaceae bacterium]|nr:DUF421 domain-containing protein [Oscillospiraceae bacterium]